MYDYNPFKENRTEQMRDLWKYYVPIPEFNNSGKPLVIEGGRGSGKTMYFQCNSWKEVLMKLRKENKPIDCFFTDNDFIGLYYRVDTTFVSSMTEPNFRKWDSVFETYLSICILREITSLIIEINKDMPIDKEALSNFSEVFSKKIYPNSNVTNIIELRNETSLYLDKIEDLINGINIEFGKDLRLVNSHRFIRDLCLFANSLFKKTISYRIFIDEYETLQKSQQKVINTLIKHSEVPVIYNIGLRPSGMKTPATVSETESIEAPHDYEYINLDIDSDRFTSLIKTICEKRITLAKENGRIPADAKNDIEWYLGRYDINYELNKFENNKQKPPFHKTLVEKINERAALENLSSEKTQLYIKTLCDSAPLLNARLHLSLLQNNDKYIPSLNELYSCYTSNNDRYKEWMHNRKNAIVFLLCKEYKREKLYFGVDAFVAMSSGIVRYFLELCEQTFMIQFLDGYDWDKAIEPETQSEAARYVSRYKIKDIVSYQPYGNELRIFVQYLGKIFNMHHTNDYSLGEPEPNHFSTKDLAISSSDNKRIKCAIMCNVLQQKSPTKRKSSVQSPETMDYYLNKIYAPYFGISYRNQRKITIDNSVLTKLLSGNDNKASDAYFDYLNKHFNYNPKQISLFDKNGDTI